MTNGIRLIIFGRQGAGKGTQASRLAARFGVPHVSTGDMLRAAVKDGTEFGRKAKEFMDAGHLLPDRGIDLAINLEVPEDVVVERISSRRVCLDCGTNYSVTDESGSTGVCA